MLDYDKLLRAVYPNSPRERELAMATILELIKYDAYYNNAFWRYITDMYPEYQVKKREKKYVPTQVSTNYVRYFINALAYWQFGIFPGINVEATQIDKHVDRMDYKPSAAQEGANLNAEEVEQYLYDVLDHNQFERKLYQAAIESNKSGGCVARIGYDERKGGLRVFFRPRMECFVPEPEDVDFITRVHFGRCLADERYYWVETLNLDDDGRCHVYERIYDGINTEAPAKVITNDYLPDEIDFMPVVFCNNEREMATVWGVPETRDLIPLQNEISKRRSDAADSLRFEMFAIKVLLNAKESEDGLGVNPGDIWLIEGQDAQLKPDVKSLSSQFSWAIPLENHIKALKDDMHTLSGIVRLTPSEINGLGNLSGTAIKLMFASTIAKTNSKMKFWVPSLQELFAKTIRMGEVYENAPPAISDVTKITHSMPIPNNRNEEVVTASNEIAAKLSTIKRQMNILGIENPEREIAEILEEKKTIEEALLEIEAKRQALIGRDTDNTGVKQPTGGRQETTDKNKENSNK